MATINLGAIKFNWKGAYNSSTSYAVDDVVSSGGNSYVCIQAHSNQAVGNATAYWNIMSSAGTNGTNGTDISTTLTTQGDMLYRDGSQELRMNSGATAPEWHTPAVATSDFVLLASHNHGGSNIAGFNFEGVISATYESYYLALTNIVTSSHNTTLRFLTGTNTERSDSSYKTMGDFRYNSSYDNFDENGADRFRFSPGFHANSGNDAKGSQLNFWFSAEPNKTANGNAQWSTMYYSGNSNRVVGNTGHSFDQTGLTITGIKIYADGGTIANANARLYGLK
jgi:hypothetical protein